jgi:hypothetical protein
MKNATALKWPFIVVIVFAFTACNAPNNKGSQGDSSYVATDTSIHPDPLPSWNEGAVKKGLLDFVAKTTKAGSPDFIQPDDRIATFDNDGTLWSEQPLYFQFLFSFARIKQMAPQHPEWKTKEPFRSLLTGNMKGVMASGQNGLLAIMGATCGGMTSEEFNKQVSAWADTAVHPITKKKFTEMVYQPMLELLAFLRANGYQTFIVSGGDIAFMRAWVQKSYGIPPPQVVGSSMKSTYQMAGDTATIMRLPALNFMDDGPGKPIGIYEHIGKKPAFAAGNSDGDYQMLQWTSSNTLPHMEIIVHHTDSIREWKYDRGSPIGKLEKGLDDAPKYGWTIVDMKNDWKYIFPYNK